MADELMANETPNGTINGSTVITTEDLSIIPIANQPLELDQAPLGAEFALPFQGSAELELKIRTTTYGLKVDTPSEDLNVYAVDVTQKPDSAQTASSIVKVRVAPVDKSFEVKVSTPQPIVLGPVTIAKVAISVSKGRIPEKREEPESPKKPEKPEEPQAT